MREAQGLGLGLSIVDRIARVLRLELRIRSVKGSGSCFSVLLPLTDAAGDAAARRGPATSTWRAAGGRGVICIDNDARILEGMRALLEGWGCEVRVAAWQRALDEIVASGFQPDLALVDYHLDNEDGIEVIASCGRPSGRTCRPRSSPPTARRNCARRPASSTCRSSTSRSSRPCCAPCCRATARSPPPPNRRASPAAWTCRRVPAISRTDTVSEGFRIRCRKQRSSAWASP
jgi:hypothetical protein